MAHDADVDIHPGRQITPWQLHRRTLIAWLILFYIIQDTAISTFSNLFDWRLRGFLSGLVAFSYNPFGNQPEQVLIDGLQLSYVISAALSYYIVTRETVSRILLRAKLDIPFQLIGRGSDETVQFEGIKSLIEDIEIRIRRLQARSNLILGIVIAALMCGVVLVIFAGRLTSIDAAAISNITAIKDEITSLDRAISEVDTRVIKLTRPSNPLSAPNSPTTSSASTEDGDMGIAALNEERRALINRRDSISQTLGKFWETEVNSTTHDKLTDTNYITATFLTRVGILAILIFLVQILISLYKYNTRI